MLRKGRKSWKVVGRGSRRKSLQQVVAFRVYGSEISITDCVQFIVTSLILFPILCPGHKGRWIGHPFHRAVRFCNISIINLRAVPIQISVLSSPKAVDSNWSSRLRDELAALFFLRFLYRPVLALHEIILNTILAAFHRFLSRFVFLSSVDNYFISNRNWLDDRRF